MSRSSIAADKDDDRIVLVAQPREEFLRHIKMTVCRGTPSAASKETTNTIFFQLGFGDAP